MGKKYFCGIIGIIILAFGLNIMIITNLGVSSYDSFNLLLTKVGLQFIINDSLINFGNISFFTQFLCAFVIFIFHKRMNITLSALLISFLTAFVATRVIIFMSGFFPKSFEYSQAITWILFSIGLFLFIYGISLLVLANIFVAPIDKLIIGIATIYHTKYGIIKFIFDFVLLIIGFSLSLIFKLNIAYTFATVLITFTTGPFANILCKFNKKILKM